MSERKRALAERAMWREIAHPLGLQVGGWTGDQQVMVFDPQIEATAVFEGDALRILKRLSLQFAERKGAGATAKSP